MNGKQRMLAALDGQGPDRLPATTHHVMEYFLKRYMNGCDYHDFFEQMQLDPIHWVNDYQYTEAQLENWRIETVVLDDSRDCTQRHYIHTPDKTLSMVTRSNQYTTYIVEQLLKEKKDIEILEKYMPVPRAGKETIEKAAKDHPECLIRGTLICLSPFSQPGCWQELAMLYGIEDLILETFDDEGWVKETLTILQKKKLEYAATVEGCPYDLIEMGGGDASTTVISPQIFDEFVAPYDAPIIAAFRKAGQRVVYHTCGGMMPILESLADMGPNALETFTPIGMGGDADLKEAKRRLGNRICMIGGFDQSYYFTKATPEETRCYVRKCFEEAGEGGRFILSPSDHFFDAEPELIRAFAQEAAACRY